MYIRLHFKSQLLLTVFCGLRLLIYVYDAIPSKYTKPMLVTVTPTRPCFLHRVAPKPRRRVGGLPRGCGSSCGRCSLIVGLISETPGHLPVGPRLLRGRFAFVDTFIVALVAIGRHQND